jgi:hypothetical protein
LRRYRARSGDYPDWRAILSADAERWTAALAGARGGEKVLIATSAGGYLPGAMLEGALAAALTLRGAEVHVLLCDAQLPACQESDIAWFPDAASFARTGPSRDLCATCFAPGNRMYQGLGVRVHRLGDYLSPEDHRASACIAAGVPFDEIPAFTMDGLPLGRHALAGALRFYARGSLEGEPRADAVLRRYLRAAIVTATATRRLLDAEGFAVATFHHGIYVPQGVIGDVARERGVRVVNWNVAYRKQRFIFSHDDTYHHTLMDEPVSDWERLPWTKGMEEELRAYLTSRRRGDNDWISFLRATGDTDAKLAALGLDPDRPVVGMLTNVMWDAELHYPARVFPSMRDWALRTVAYFAARPELQLLIRVHPGEIAGTPLSRQPFVEELRRAFPRLPANIFVIPPESDINTYAAMSRCNAAIVYGTKTGVELAAMGLPVIVAGEAWARGKGFTEDAASVEHYVELLDRLPGPGRLATEATARARRYAYHFFFRRMIPLRFTRPVEGWPVFRLRVRRIADLAPGADAGLDVVCDGILRNTPFIYPAACVEHHVEAATTSRNGAAADGPSLARPSATDRARYS